MGYREEELDQTLKKWVHNIVIHNIKERVGLSHPEHTMGAEHSAMEKSDANPVPRVIGEDCAVCLEPSDAMLRMPCCGVAGSTIAYCRTCVRALARYGIDGRIGRCPTCNGMFTLEDDGKDKFNLVCGAVVHANCQKCRQPRVIVDQARQYCEVRHLDASLSVIRSSFLVCQIISPCRACAPTSRCVYWAKNSSSITNVTVVIRCS